MNYIIKSRRYVKKGNKETGRKGIYYQLSCLVNTCTKQNRLQVIVLAEFSRIQQTWQNLAEVIDVADITDIAVETDRQNMAEYGRIWQIAVDCCRLRQSRDWSLIAKLIKTGGRV